MIPIAIIDGHGYIFNLDHMKVLREQHHVTGVLIGVLPQFPQQNVFMGLPIQLMPEEVKYLLEKEVAFIFNDTAHHEEFFAKHTAYDSTKLTVEMKSPVRDIGELERRSEITAKAHPIAYKEPNLASYQMFRYLVSNDMFCMPGLRFGCHFLAYPGDPLRFHAHFNTRGLLWDQKFDILDIIGCGRLATAVKKAWVVGAEDENGQYKAFSIEWAGFG